MSNFKFFNLISTIILFDISLCMVVFPFKTIKEEKNGEINENSEEYNSNHFLNDYFTRPNYIPMKIGLPQQDVNFLISLQECGFKIGNFTNCKKYMTNYLSNYNPRNSMTIKYINFDNEECSAEETIYAYDDLHLKDIKKFSNIGFNLGNREENNNICGIIGLKLGFSDECIKLNNIIKNFKSNKITSNYKWMMKYNSLDEGLFIIGANMDEIIPNYNDENLFYSYAIMTGMNLIWGFPLRQIKCGDNITINTNEKEIKLDIDFSLIKGDRAYYEYIETYFFQKYYSKGICYKYLWNYDEFSIYNTIECKKGKFGNDDIDKFPNLSFNIDSGIILNFEGKDLFTETKYKYFFNIVFINDGSMISILERNSWIFGKIFFKKFPVIMDWDAKRIFIYNNYNYTKEVQ